MVFTPKMGAVAALLMGQNGALITGGDFLMDGGITASYWFGELAQGNYNTGKAINS
ncbi:MAG TPA: hypothetical protein VIF12_00305 [Micavibrio sp.]|jgi:hypothetical protein